MLLGVVRSCSVTNCHIIISAERLLEIRPSLHRNIDRCCASRIQRTGAYRLISDSVLVLVDAAMIPLEVKNQAAPPLGKGLPSKYSSLSTF